MNPTVAMLGAGGMGAALGASLVRNGIVVSISLAGRGEATISRALAAGLTPVMDEEIGEADFILSVLPPSQAMAAAEQLAPLLRAAKRDFIYADLNAISPDTTIRIGEIIAPTGATYVDGGIIGLPPAPGKRDPRIYVSGAGAEKLKILSEFGLDVRVLDGPIGAASALKMSFGGITKGILAVTSTMILASERSGTSEWLRRELVESQKDLFSSLQVTIPDMLPKAGRWVKEMEEISTFVGSSRSECLIHAGAASLFARLAEDEGAGGEESRALKAFLRDHPP